MNIDGDNNIQVGTHISYKKTGGDNKKSWQDNILLYILIGVLIVIIGFIATNYLGNIRQGTKASIKVSAPVTPQHWK